MTLVHVLHRHKLAKNQTLLVLYFRASRFRGEPASRELHKFADVSWFQADALPEEVSKPTRHVLEQIRKGGIYSEFPARSKVLAFWEQIGQKWTGLTDF
jgi:hypothetical protein